MAYSKKLIAANENLFTAYEKGRDSNEYKIAKVEWLKVFAEVALEKGEPVIYWENPYELIVEAIASNENPEWIEEKLDDYKEMVECLESIGYYAAQHWRDGYEECLADFNR